MSESLGRIKAGKAFVLIEAVDATGKILKSIRRRLGAFAAELTQLGKTTVMRTSMAMLPVGFAVKAGAEFDDIMRKVSARSDGTAADLAYLRKQAIELGEAFGVLPSAIGNAQNVFAQAGFDRKEIAAIVPEVVLLARAVGDSADQMENLQQASDAVTSVIRAFHMPANKAAEVAGKLAITAKTSSFGLEGITTALSHAAAIAGEYKVSLDEMLAVMSAMKDIQIDDSIVGTAFKNMMGYMSQEDEQIKFNQRLKEATGNTIEFADAVTGNLHGPLKLLPALLKATETMGSAKRLDLMFGLLETRAVVPAMAAGRSTERMAQVLEKLQHWQGATKSMQEEMDAGLGGAFRRFSAAIYNLEVALTDALAPMLIAAAKYIQAIAPLLGEWIKRNQKLTVGIIASGVALIVFGAALVVVGQGLFAITTILGVLSGLASLIAFVFTPLAVAAVAAGVAVYYAEDAIGDLTNTGNSFDKVFSKIPDSLTKTAQSIERLTGIAGEFQRIGTHIKDTWSETFNSITVSLTNGNIENAFATLLASIKLQFAEAVQYMQKLWFDLVNLPRSLQTTNNPLLRGASGYNRSADNKRLEALEKQLKVANAEADAYKRQGMNKGMGSPEYNRRVQIARDAIQRQKELMQERTNARAYREDVDVDRLRDFKYESGQTAAIEAMEANVKALRAQRQAILDQSQSDIDTAQMLKEYMGSMGAFDKSIGDYSGKLKEILEGADSIVIPGQKGFNVAPKALEAIESTSIEAVKHFQENRYNAEMTDLAHSSLDIARSSNSLLDQIATSINQLRLSAV